MKITQARVIELGFICERETAIVNRCWVCLTGGIGYYSYPRIDIEFVEGEVDDVPEMYLRNENGSFLKLSYVETMRDLRELYRLLSGRTL